MNQLHITAQRLCSNTLIASLTILLHFKHIPSTPVFEIINFCVAFWNKNMVFETINTGRTGKLKIDMHSPPGCY